MRKALCVIPVIAASLCAGAARANTIYTYTGEDFTDVSGLYTTSDSVDVTFTMTSPLADNLSYAILLPISYVFTDGVDTITNTSPSLPAHSRSAPTRPDKLTSGELTPLPPQLQATKPSTQHGRPRSRG
jgi:hypothetical protein